MRKLIINRKIWLRGEDSLRSFLLRGSDNKMCCLGIYLESCGVPKSKLMGHQSAPMVLKSEVLMLPKEAQWLIDSTHLPNQNSDVASALMEINDDSGTPDVERETYVTNKFREHGVEVEFTDGE